MQEKPPWLFIYFVPNIKVLKATNGEFWLCEIGTGNGIVHKFSKSLIDLWDRHFISLPPGFWWSGLLFREKGVDQTFSPAGSRDVIFSIPEKYIRYIYDMENSDYIYQYIPPNPPWKTEEKSEAPQTCSLAASIINDTCCGTKPPYPPR